MEAIWCEKPPVHYRNDVRYGTAGEMMDEIDRLRSLLKEIDKRTMFEAFGAGNTFGESIECYLQHGGKCPTVEEAYAGALRCEAHMNEAGGQRYPDTAIPKSSEIIKPEVAQVRDST